MASNRKLQNLLDTKLDVILRYSRKLAMDFETPATAIVSMACQDLGITKQEWITLSMMRSEAEKKANTAQQINSALIGAEEFIQEELETRRESGLDEDDPYIARARKVLEAITAAIEAGKHVGVLDI